MSRSMCVLSGVARRDRLLTLSSRFQVAAAEASSWSVVYLKDVAVELDEEEPGEQFNLVASSAEAHRFSAASSRPHKLRADLADRLLLSRLSLSPSNLVDDPERITVVAALPQNETSFEYLGGCWRRERTERSRVVAKKVGESTATILQPMSTS